MFASTCKFFYTRSAAEHFSGGSESRISWSTSVTLIQNLQGNFSVNCADYNDLEVQFASCVVMASGKKWCIGLKIVPILK